MFIVMKNVDILICFIINLINFSKVNVYLFFFCILEYEFNIYMEGIYYVFYSYVEVK